MTKRRKKRRSIFGGKRTRKLPLKFGRYGRAVSMAGLAVIGLMALWTGWQVVSDWGTRTWMGIEPYRYVAVVDEPGSSDSVRLIQYFPGDNSVLVFAVSQEIQVDTARGYGKYRVGSLLDLGEQEGEGIELLRDSLQLALGLLIRDVVVVNEEEFEDVHQLADWIESNNWAMVVAGIRGESNLVDAVNVWWRMRGLHGEAVEEYSLSGRNIFNITSDVDGAELLAFNYLLLDDLQERKVGSNRLVWHDVSVVVENATRQSGLASQISRLVTHEGYDVVGLEDSDQYVPQTKLIFANEELRNSVEADLLLRIFPQAQATVGNIEEYRSDVVVRVGEDMSD